MLMSLEEKLRRGAAWAGFLAAAIGATNAIGRLLGVDLLGWLRHDPWPMTGDSAGGLVLGGAALWLAHRGRFPRLGFGCAFVMLVVAVSRIARFPAGRYAAVSDAVPYPAVVLALLAVALLLLSVAGGGSRQPLRLWLAGLVVSFTAATLFTLAFSPATDAARANLLGLPFSLAALALGVGAILARPGDTFIRLFFAPTASGMLARRLFFGAVLVPAVLSRLFIMLVLNDVVHFNDGVLLLASMMMFSGFVITMLSAGRAVSQDEWRADADRERLQLTTKLEHQAAQLQEMVSQRTRELHEANAGLSAAAESNAGLALVANHTTNGVVIADAFGRVEWCNTAFERLTGFALPEIKGHKPGPFLQGPDSDQATIGQLRQAVHRGEPCKVEILNYTKEKRPFWQTIDLEPVRDRTGKVLKYISIQTDITEQRLAKQRLHTLNHRLELATRAAALGVWEWDQLRQKFIWDHRMMQIHGVSLKEFGGTFEEWSRDLHPEDRGRTLQAFESVRAGANELELAFRLVTRGTGSVRYLETRGIAERNPQGQLLRITGTCRDITADREATLQLAALNERLKLALSSSNYGVWELELATNRMTWDDRMFQIYAIRREDFDGSREVWESRLHPDDRAGAKDFARRVIAGEIARYDTTFRIVLSDGAVRHIEAHGYVQRDGKGAALRLVGLNRDITSENRTIEALKIAEERWQLAIEGTNDAAWDWDVQTGVVFHDERWARMLGHEPAEIDSTLQGWRRIMHPDDLPAYAEAIDNHFHRRAPFYSQELRVKAKDGQWRWVLDRGKVVSRDPDGHPLRMAGTHTDVTDRKQLEQRLQRMEELASQVSQLAQIGGWELELESGQLTWSRVVSNLFEFPEDFTPSLPAMIEVFAPEAQITLQAALQAARASAASFDLELLANAVKSGRRIWVRVIGKPHLQHRRAWSIQGAIQDITARHESEDARHQLELQLFQAQKMETLGTFAGGIAHDFNNLLTGIIGYHELAADSLTPDHPAHSCLLEARNASLRARELVEQILTFGRQSSGIEHGTVDLAMVIDEARRFLRATIPATIDISAEVAEDRFHVLGDATQIHQVIFNLGSNAAHAMRTTGGTIKITLQAEELTSEQSSRLGGVTSGKYVRLSVSDTGHGMDEATMRRIFEPFFTTKNTREGTGLGLAVVHGIVRAHRGAIAVDSELGVGSTFHIYLPAAQEENASVKPIFATGPQGAGEFICVVDDEEIVGSCTKLALEGKGYQAVRYASAAECLAAFARDRRALHVLLTDQTMPGMQGTELAAEIRKIYPDLPVVIMSGYFSKISSQALDELGNIELLAKPFTTDELAQAVDRALHPKVE